jgi:hypothetical protein
MSGRKVSVASSLPEGVRVIGTVGTGSPNDKTGNGFATVPPRGVPLSLS